VGLSVRLAGVFAIGIATASGVKSVGSHPPERGIQILAAADPQVRGDLADRAQAVTLDTRDSIGIPPQPARATIPETAFWLAAALVVYTYVGYPAIVWLFARLRPWTVRRHAYLPSVSVVVVAYNEEERIAARIRNLLELYDPAELREVVVVSDGSTDRTAALAAEVGPPVRVID
jgi:hypothetical protein